MKLEMLGAFGGDTVKHHITSFLVDDFLALDAGCLTSALDLDQQAGISDILLSHSHIDHLATLPFLIDNVFDSVVKPINVWAGRHVIDALKTHIFNEVIWPDFSKLPSPDHPSIILNVLEAEKSFEVRHLRITPIPVTHTVPCFGYLLESSKTNSALLYTSDTTSTDRVWEIAGKTPNLKAVIVDCSFPNDMEKLARSSGHMTPGLLAKDLTKLKNDDVRIYIYHIKPMFEDRMIEEIRALHDPRLIIGSQSQRLEV